jgi:hypothetical protein
MSQLKQLINEGKKYFVHKGILKYFDGKNELLVIPKNHQQILMLHYHDGALGGHLSPRKTLSRLKQKYYWETMEQDVKEWCNTCKVCLTRKNTGKRIKVPLKPMPVPLAPMELCAMDIVGPLPETIKGNKYILVFCDYLTKWAVANPMPNQKTETVAQVFVEEIIFRYGTPMKLLTDQGSNFMSEFFKSVTEMFGITKLNTSPYHPQTDGLVERFNGTLLNMISSYVNSGQTDWDVHLSSCVYAYNNAVHPATGETPFYLMHLRHNNMPIDLNYEQPKSHLMEVPDYKTLMQERMQLAWQKAGLKIKYNQEEYKEAYDKKAKDHDLKIGDLVYLNKPEPKKGLSPKLQRPYKGPYRVCGITATNVRLQAVNNKNAEIIVVHANRCKKVQKVEEPRYNLRSKNKKQNNEFKQNINLSKKTKHCNYLSLIPWICWLSLPLSQALDINYFPAKFELPILKQLRVYSSYNVIIWQCQCLINETFQLHYSKGEKLGQIILNNKEKTAIIRHLKTNQQYDFRIKYWEDTKILGLEPQFIMFMQIWTKDVYTLLSIEPSWSKIIVTSKLNKLEKVLVQYSRGLRSYSRTLSNSKPFLIIDELAMDQNYTLILIYYEAQLHNNLSYASKKMIPFYTETRIIKLEVEPNPVIINVTLDKIYFYRKSNKNEQVIIINTLTTLHQKVILNYFKSNGEMLHLQEEETFVKFSYFRKDNTRNKWIITFVEEQIIRTPIKIVLKNNQTIEDESNSSFLTIKKSEHKSFKERSKTINNTILNFESNYYFVLIILFFIIIALLTMSIIQCLVILKKKNRSRNQEPFSSGHPGEQSTLV